MSHHRPLAGRAFACSARERTTHDTLSRLTSSRLPCEPSSVTRAVTGVPPARAVGVIWAASLTLAAGNAMAQQAPATADVAQGTAALPATSVSAGRDDDVRVERVSSGALGTRRAVDTPFSVVAVNSEQIKNQMAQTATDAFKWDPAVSTLSENKRNEHA